MQNENTKRAWLYARIPGNDVETLRCIRECAAKAQQDNCKIVGRYDLDAVLHDLLEKAE